VKASELKLRLDDLPADCDPEVVMGELWLPERLVGTQHDNDMLFLQFDNAPEEGEGEEEGRGFVQHEINLIRERITQLLNEPNPQSVQVEALVALLLLAHEQSSSEFVEMISDWEL